MDSPNADTRNTVLIIVGTCTVGFIAAFNIGAFGVIFYEHVYAGWIAATIVFIASLVSEFGPQTWAPRTALLLPSLCVVLTSLTTVGAVDPNDVVLQWVALIVTVVSLPFLAYSLVEALDPGFFELPSTHKRLVVTAIVIVSALGLVMGINNDLFLTCEDFEISGNALPESCRPASID